MRIQLLMLGDCRTMDSSQASFKHQLLDLLVDTPASLAALYGTLVRDSGSHGALALLHLMDALDSLERQGWIRVWLIDMAGTGVNREPSSADRAAARAAYEAWLPGAQPEELSLDEIGFWYELTTEGREEWRQWVAASHNTATDEPSPKWVLDELTDIQSIVIHAENVRVAEQALRAWLALRPDMQLNWSSRQIEEVTTFKLSNGDTTNHGIKLIYKYNQVGPQ